MVTVWGFLAQPERHFFLKPRVTQLAAKRYGFPLEYVSRPNGKTYTSVLEFASLLKQDLADLCPCDMIDFQSFLWVQGSDEYA